MQRLEQKFLIPIQYKKSLQQDLLIFCKPDPYHVEGIDNWISSYYFDTPAKSAYVQKLMKASYRYKVRFRFYSNSQYLHTQPIGKFEWKAKSAGETTKEFWRVSWDFTRDLIEGKVPLTNSETEKKVVEILKADHLFPSITVKYKRESYFSNVDTKIRFTFDQNLIVSNVGSNFEYLFLPKNLAVFEIKSEWGNLWPTWLINILTKYQLERVAFSKYSEATSCLINNSQLVNAWI